MSIPRTCLVVFKARLHKSNRQHFLKDITETSNSRFPRIPHSLFLTSRDMTSALDEAFKQCEARGRIAFVPYLTAGYPTKGDTVQLMLAMQKGGADVIELGRCCCAE